MELCGFIIITSAFKNIKGKLTKKDMLCSLKIIINKKSKYIKSIIDTGNFLREPISKLPVVVVEKRALEKVIPEYVLDNLDKIIDGQEVDLQDYMAKVRLIPFSSLGKENGMLLGIKADAILVETDEKSIVLSNAIIGIYNGILNKMGKYQALIGLDIIEGYEKVNEYVKSYTA